MANRETLQVVVAGEAGQGGLDQVLIVGEVGILLHRYRATFLDGIQIPIDEHRLGVFEVQAVAFELLCFFDYLVQYNDGISKFTGRDCADDWVAVDLVLELAHCDLVVRRKRGHDLLDFADNFVYRRNLVLELLRVRLDCGFIEGVH